MSSLLVFNRVYKLEPCQLCWYFWPRFVNYCPYNLLSGLPPLLPLHKVKVQYTQKMCGWEGVRGVLSCVGDYILQEFLTRFRTYKIKIPTNKNLGGEGPQTDKHLPQSPFTCKFGIAFYQSNLSLLYLRHKFKKPEEERRWTSDFDAQMCGIKRCLRPCYKKKFSEILNGCFHFGLFSS